MKQALVKFLRDEEGASAIEYGLIAGLVAVFLIASLTLLGGSLGTFFTSIATKLGVLSAPA